MQSINLKPKQTKTPQMQKAENFPPTPKQDIFGTRVRFSVCNEEYSKQN